LPKNATFLPIFFDQLKFLTETMRINSWRKGKKTEDGGGKDFHHDGHDGKRKEKTENGEGIFQTRRTPGNTKEKTFFYHEGRGIFDF
jgi:hypothetical protein